MYGIWLGVKHEVTYCTASSHQEVHWQNWILTAEKGCAILAATTRLVSAQWGTGWTSPPREAFQKVHLTHLPTEAKGGESHHAVEDKEQLGPHRDTTCSGPHWGTCQQSRVAPRSSASRPRPATPTTTKSDTVQFSFLPTAINPFTASNCKISGLKDTRTRLQRVYFPVL